MNELNYFDLGVSAVILLLGLKGLLNGFFKELFGTIGIIGGIYVGSRYATETGAFLSDKLFHFENSAVITFTGFLATLAVFWIVMALVGGFFTKLTSMTGLNTADKIMGFILATTKIFLILSVTVYALSNIKIIQSTIGETMQNSILYPVLKQAGQIVVKIDPSAFLDENETSAEPSAISKEIDKTVKTVKEQISIEHTAQDTQTKETITNE